MSLLIMFLKFTKGIVLVSNNFNSAMLKFIYISACCMDWSCYDLSCRYSQLGMVFLFGIFTANNENIIDINLLSTILSNVTLLYF